jgi:hypothetical protein
MLTLSKKLLRRDSSWERLRPPQQLEIARLLPTPTSPNTASFEAAIFGALRASDDDHDNVTVPAALVQHRILHSKAFRTDIRLFKEDLIAGRLDPHWLASAALSSARRAAGEFDAFLREKAKVTWPDLEDYEDYEQKEEEAGSSSLNQGKNCQQEGKAKSPATPVMDTASEPESEKAHITSAEREPPVEISEDKLENKDAEKEIRNDTPAVEVKPGQDWSEQSGSEPIRKTRAGRVFKRRKS